MCFLYIVLLSFFLGLFNYDHMSYEYSRPKGDMGEPSLTEMVDMAVKILKKNPKGYFLLVEGNCSLTANALEMYLFIYY